MVIATIINHRRHQWQYAYGFKQRSGGTQNLLAFESLANARMHSAALRQKFLDQIVGRHVLFEGIEVVAHVQQQRHATKSVENQLFEIGRNVRWLSRYLIGMHWRWNCTSSRCGVLLHLSPIPTVNLIVSRHTHHALAHSQSLTISHNLSRIVDVQRFGEQHNQVVVRMAECCQSF
jgi:hypothetical protein